jgi:hypothetical protein
MGFFLSQSRQFHATAKRLRPLLDARNGQLHHNMANDLLAVIA